MSANHENEKIVAESPGLECPICHREIQHDIEAHLTDTHPEEELISFVARYALEMEEKRPSP